MRLRSDAMRHSVFAWLPGGLAGAVLAIGLAIVVYATSGTDDLTVRVWTPSVYVVANLLALGLATLLVAVVRGGTRPPGVIIGFLAVVVVAALFPVKREWLDAEYLNGRVPLAQSLLMRPVPGAATADGEPMPGPPAFAYTE